MALKGTLEDISVVDLVQYPHGGRRTGELFIESAGYKARIFYVKGAMVHAVFGTLDGFDALVEIVEWKEGEFQFNTGVESNRRTIKGHIIHNVMEALRVADERRRDRKRKEKETGLFNRLRARYGADEGIDPRLFRKLVDFLSSNVFALHATIIAEDGSLLAEASAKGKRPDEIETLREVFLELVHQYPRSDFDRAVFEDKAGTVVLARVKDTSVLIVISSTEAPIGAVFGGVNKLRAKLA